MPIIALSASKQRRKGPNILTPLLDIRKESRLSVFLIAGSSILPNVCHVEPHDFLVVLDLT